MTSQTSCSDWDHEVNKVKVLLLPLHCPLSSLRSPDSLRDEMKLGEIK